MKIHWVLLYLSLSLAYTRLAWAHINGYGDHPLSKIAIHKATVALRDSASIKAHPFVLGLKVIQFVCSNLKTQFLWFIFIKTFEFRL